VLYKIAKNVFVYIYVFGLMYVTVKKINRGKFMKFCLVRDCSYCLACHNASAQTRNVQVCDNVGAARKSDALCFM
jgi:hypothetical protein